MPQPDVNFEIAQSLDPQGRLTGDLPASLSGRDQLLELYRVMVLTRVFDRAAINLQRTGSLGTYPSGEGQEAIGAGVGFAMRDEDLLIPYYRDIATQVQRGVLLEEILRYWGGDEWGMHYRRQKEDFPISVPIATQACHAVGVACAFKYRGQARVAVTTCGDGATSKGDFYESINIAGVMRLPVVFVVNNNRWAISVPLDKQTASKSIAHKALAAGIDGYRVDGNDAIAVVGVMQEALEQAREHQRPSIVEALSYRLGDHTTADDASRYRTREELESARKSEPLLRFKVYLQSEHGWRDEDDEELYASCNAEVEKAIEAYQAAPEQKPGEFFDYVFAAPTADLQGQKQEWLTEVKRHG
ncbi:MAG: pyruvate dehydrogenase (acetyl-transferring) E1 component subunit alpha [Gammaproteobacteria bacterium]|jgi:pyruvate dehydrogenase E1 component alpha subunit